MNTDLKKKFITNVLIMSLLLGGCGSNVKENGGSNTSDREYLQNEIKCSNEGNYYLSKSHAYIDLNVLNDSEYVSIAEDDNKYTLCEGSSIFIKDNKEIIDEIVIDSPIMVHVLEANSKYAKVLFGNDLVGYVRNISLVKCANLRNKEYSVIYDNKEMIIKNDTYAYDSVGLFLEMVPANTRCVAVASNEEYTLVTLENGENVFILSSEIDYKNIQINGYGLIKENTCAYFDNDFNNIAYNLNVGDVVYISAINNKYASVIDNELGEVFIDINDIDSDFIIVDLDNQQMDCYLNYLPVGSWKTRTGRDSTPTHPGTFDIDWKAENWEFTTYRGSYAHHWIPINEYGEGIHDLIGDDEENYGNEAYHSYGSHGCIRVPEEASEFVYDNYEVGDYVLVRKK